MVGVIGAILVAAAGLVVATLDQYLLSLVAYVAVLVLGVAFIAHYRYRSMQRTLSTQGHVMSRSRRRLALIPVLLVFVACAANAFVWASEVAKR
jgi:hypothetical protein